MKILLIGHSILDNIEMDGQIKISPGGIYYSLNGMLAAKNVNDEIFLATALNDKYKNLFEVYSEANLTLSTECEDMPEVILKLNDNSERGEIYKNISTNLDLGKIMDWNFFDGILINMITGFDLSLEQVVYIRKNFNKNIYLDIHTLSRGVDENMNRSFRQIPLIEKWLENVDVLQCNENELKTIYDDEEEMAAVKILKSGIKILLVTKSEKGATAYFLSANNLKKLYVQAVKSNTVNKIGCGDVFGSVFFYSYLSGVNLHDSLIMANKAAGASVECGFPVNFNELEQKIKKCQ